MARVDIGASVSCTSAVGAGVPDEMDFFDRSPVLNVRGGCIDLMGVILTVLSSLVGVGVREPVLDVVLTRVCFETCSVRVRRERSWFLLPIMLSGKIGTAGIYSPRPSKIASASEEILKVGPALGLEGCHERHLTRTVPSCSIPNSSLRDDPVAKLLVETLSIDP